MRLKEMMTSRIELIAQQASVADAARKMKSLNVGALPVFSNNELVGMITDRDITIRAVAGGLNPEEVAVQEVMSPQVESILDSEDVAAAAQKMKQNRIRRLIVQDKDGKVAGIVSLGDLAVRGDAPDATEEALERISEPAEPIHS